MKKYLFTFFTLTLIFTSVSINAQKNSNIEKNKDFIKVYTEDFWNKHNIAAFEKYFTGDFIYTLLKGI